MPRRFKRTPSLYLGLNELMIRVFSLLHRLFSSRPGSFFSTSKIAFSTSFSNSSSSFRALRFLISSSVKSAGSLSGTEMSVRRFGGRSLFATSEISPFLDRLLSQLVTVLFTTPHRAAASSLERPPSMTSATHACFSAKVFGSARTYFGRLAARESVTFHS